MLCGGVLLCLVSSARGQQPPAFKAAVTTVEVDAMVSDAQGTFVRGLTQPDFTLLEDGKPQTITGFAFVDLPADRQTVAKDADVATNASVSGGRLYVIVLDDLHIDFSRTAGARAYAHQFIEHNLQTNDLMAIVYTGRGADAGQTFTNRQPLLLSAVDRLMGQRGGAPQEATSSAIRTLRTVTNICDWFAAVPGRRKSVLFLSEGINVDLNPLNDEYGVRAVMSDALAHAATAHVAIYGVQTQGLRARANDVADDSLRQLSNGTGGFATINQNDLTRTYQRIVQDSSSYYFLAYSIPSDRRDDKFHAIEVRVARPGATVRARSGYGGAAISPPVSSADPMTAVLRGALPTSGLGLSVFATPFKGDQSNVAVLLGAEVSGRDLTFGEGQRLDLSYVAVDPIGVARASGTASVPLDAVAPAVRDQITRTGIRLLNRAILPPGRYEIRVAVQQPSGPVGSVFDDVELPDFSKTALSISGIALTSKATSLQPTLQMDAGVRNQLKAALPAPPGALRAFSAGDEIDLFAEIYDRSTSPAHTVTITTSVLDADGHTALQTSNIRMSTERDAARASYAHVSEIPLNGISAGAYTLRIDAQSSLNARTVASRQVSFSVTTP